MPKRRRSAKARSTSTKRRRKRKPRSNARTGGFLGMERKFFDVELNADQFSTTWATEEPATTNLSAVAQGDGESNRDGRKYVIQSIHIKGVLGAAVQESQTTPPSDIFARLVLVVDTQTNGAQLTATDVMDGGQTNDVLSFRNLQFTKRFKVIWDRTFVIKRPNTNEGAANLFASASVVTGSFKINHAFKGGLSVTMSGTTADIANVTDNSIHMIAVADSTAGLISYQSRIRFVG